MSLEQYNHPSCALHQNQILRWMKQVPQHFETSSKQLSWLVHSNYRCRIHRQKSLSSTSVHAIWLNKHGTSVETPEQSCQILKRLGIVITMGSIYLPSANFGKGWPAVLSISFALSLKSGTSGWSYPWQCISSDQHNQSKYWCNKGEAIHHVTVGKIESTHSPSPEAGQGASTHSSWSSVSSATGWNN